MNPVDTLNLFLPPVGSWFRAALGTPTAAQKLGWPAIAAGLHTLILAPTGSGKTLAAFLACLDRLWRQETPRRGVQVLYVSPLKALNNDIYRNLQLPLAGVAATARQMNIPLPEIEIAIRTGDTPAAERQRLVRRPPHVLITTPESLHLLLTSRARETLRGVTHCIIDEIHALCPNKRGVFLALLLERLAELNPRGFVRIGLSATQRPLEEVARYLGGQVSGASPDGPAPRPVTIVDAGLRKDLDLRVVSPVEHFGPLPEKTIWPSIYRLLAQEIGRHRSTIIFANNRRTVERITACLNAGWSIGNDPSSPRDEPWQLVPVEEDAPAANSPPNARPLALAHHGSVALEVRQQTELALKEGRLPAVVATASLELGIDMGAVELVCQVESPGTVARGLQRVGRAGHIVGRRSKGRLIPKTLADLCEQAVLAHEMAAGNVEPIRVPLNCLDVLAQQVVAMVAMEDWDVSALYAVVRRAYPYRDLTPQAFESVLEMVSGRYRFDQASLDATAAEPASRLSGSSLAALQPRISWDRVHHRLQALPGSRQLALVNGGTIPDTGQYAAFTSSGVRIGELDEEFVYERRVGDVFLLGTTAWRVDRIETDRVIVAQAEGAPAMVPFWRGEQTGRSADLGLAIGQFLRDLKERLDRLDCLQWLEQDWFLDTRAAHDLHFHIRRQLRSAGTLPTDRTLVVEACRDPLGDWQVILLSPLGSRLHLALRLAIEARLTARLGYRPQSLHHDDGILFRLTDTDEPILDLFDGLTPANVEALILDELADSALFALRFRQNAARALLMPRNRPERRAPLWLQRLRGRDLLQVARRHPDFPIVVETFRECLHDHLDVARVRQLLADIQEHHIEVVVRRTETPSPFASGLLFAFTAAFMYQYDRTEPDTPSTGGLDRQLLEQLVAPQRLGHLLDPRAVQQVEHRLRGMGRPPRSPAEMAEWLRRLGDITTDERTGPMEGFLQQLEAEGQVKRLELPRCQDPLRWILTEEQDLYERAFGLRETDPAVQHESAAIILRRFLQTHALVSLADVLARYPFEERWARQQLEDWSRSGRVVALPIAAAREIEQWSAPGNLEQVQRGSLALLRREVLTCPSHQFADFVLRWQGLHPATQRGGAEGLAAALVRLQGLPLPAELWEKTILTARVPGYQTRWLDECVAAGAWVWVCQGESGDGPGLLAFWGRENLAHLPPPPADVALDDPSARVLESLRTRGASFVTDLAQHTSLPPSTVRSALWNLLRLRLVTNDHFDVIRMGKTTDPPPVSPDRARRPTLSRLRPTGRSPRLNSRPEGRWSLLPWGRSEPEAQAVFLASVLLERYGVVARELAMLDPWMLPWRVLYEVLSRMELAGEVRRGYYVEGLSGAQFALPEAARMLQETGLPSSAGAPVVLLHSLDPANLHGSGAPFDLLSPEGETRPLVRRHGTWLVQRAGRPVLLIEQHGRRLTTLLTAGREDIAEAVQCLPSILSRDLALSARHKLTVAEWNGQPVTSSPGQLFLEAAGFVRDYQEMTLYAPWR